MKKILLLGGSSQQIPAIQYANKQGYYTVLCDFLPDNPGQEFSDKFYNVSTTDKEAVLEVAKEENVNGIVAYASDPAAPTAAYVAEKLGLPTNPYKSVETLSFKNKFRRFLEEHNFHSPTSGVYTSLDQMHAELSKYEFPIMVKPIDSSGSKGVSKVKSKDKIDAAFNSALEFSRNKKVILEEYIEKDHQYLIGGDCFVKDGKVVYWGLMNCHRNPEVNPLVPVGKSYPLQISQTRLDEVKKIIQNIVDILDLKFGGFNLEIIVDSKDRVFVIEMGPRNGGNMIPELLYEINEVDMIAATIELAMGNNNFTITPKNSNKYISSYNLHTSHEGKLKEIIFTPEMKHKIFKEHFFKNAGDYVEFFSGSNKALGIVFMSFENQQEMMDTMDLKSKWYDVIVEDEN